MLIVISIVPNMVKLGTKSVVIKVGIFEARSVTTAPFSLGTWIVITLK